MAVPGLTDEELMEAARQMPAIALPRCPACVTCCAISFIFGEGGRSQLVVAGAALAAERTGIPGESLARSDSPR